jgi:hypothetical protein
MLGFLHTLPANVETFGALLAELGPAVPVRHLVDESLLADTRAAGALTEDVARRVRGAVLSLISGEARVVVCTCSTIAEAAETTPAPPGVVVMRIDRPMAERALTHGARVLVVAALASTIGPTTALLADSAQRSGRPLALSTLVCEQAWPHFQRGDQAAYAREIARCIEGNPAATSADVIVLAQASMAAAAPLLAHFPAPILASPRLGLEVALERWHAALQQRPAAAAGGNPNP